MILVPHCSGQMCNKICYFVQALALALDCKRDIVYPFGKDLHEFSDLHPEAVPDVRVSCGNLQRSKIVDGICGLFQGKLPGMREHYYNTNVERIEGFVRRPRGVPIVLWNWYFRNDAGIVRHRDAICAYLRAKESHVQRAGKILRDARGRASVVVGVHVRRGDYKTAFRGLYYYSDPEYLEFMKNFELAIGKRVVFVMVSNEPLDIEYFHTGEVEVVDASGSAAEDIVTLSECDYIMGPPSTFSWWAAYYGDKPRMALSKKGQQVDFREFAIPSRLESSFFN